MKSSENMIRALKRWSVLTAARGIQLHIDWNADAEFVGLDQSDCNRIVDNFIQNSIRSMSKPGTISVKADTVLRVSLRSSDCSSQGISRTLFACISFTDTGTAIESKHFVRLFQSGFTTRPDDGGNGLGLSSILRTVGGAGGYITVESTQRSGSTFAIFLPHAVTLTEPAK